MILSGGRRRRKKTKVPLKRDRNNLHDRAREKNKWGNSSSVAFLFFLTCCTNVNILLNESAAADGRTRRDERERKSNVVFSLVGQDWYSRCVFFLSFFLSLPPYLSINSRREKISLVDKRTARHDVLHSCSSSLLTTPTAKNEEIFSLFFLIGGNRERRRRRRNGKTNNEENSALSKSSSH